MVVTFTTDVSVLGSGITMQVSQYAVPAPSPPPNYPPTVIFLTSTYVNENDDVGALVATMRTDNTGASLCAAHGHESCACCALRCVHCGACSMLASFTVSLLCSVNTITYTLVAGATNMFNIPAGTANLLASRSFNFEVDPTSYSVTIRASEMGYNYQQAFTITVANMNDPPTDITFSLSSITENSPTSAVAPNHIGTLACVDVDVPAQTCSFSLVSTSSTPNKFYISGNLVYLVGAVDYEDPTYGHVLTLGVTALDSGTVPSQMSYTKVFTINVINAAELPTNILLSSSTVNVRSVCY
jgi:hypothetical protein